MDASATVAEQRAYAVAKLRRAASLPRMKDGRRPPMHGEVASDVERAQTDSKKDEESAANTEQEEKSEATEATETTETTEATEVPDEPSTSTPAKPPAGDVPPSAEPPTKRRSRSRSRSRGSKDLKAKQKVLENLARAASPLSSDIAAEEPPPSMAQEVPLESPTLISPTPSYFAQLQMNQPIMSPMPPLSPFGYPGTSPSTPIPTLQALQSRHLQGLFRSNSAAARMMAMHKLTGGAEPLEPSLLGVGSSGSPGKLGRNNTVGGGERHAARQLLLRRLNERIEKTDGEQTSGGEDNVSTTSKSRRRRSRRKSGQPAVVDDRDITSTSTNATNTPAATPAPSTAELAPVAGPMQLQLSQDAAAQSTSSPTPVPTPEDRREPSGAQKGDEHYEYPSPLSRRGVVVEEEEEDLPIQHTPQQHHRLPSGLPSTPSPASVAGAPRVPHTSDAPSVSSSNDSHQVDGQHVPLILSDSLQRLQYRQDTFPKSPFGTPIKEQPREEDDRVLYPDPVPSRFPWKESVEREISWVAEPVLEIPGLSPKRREPSWIPHDDLDANRYSASMREASWVEPEVAGPRMPVHDEDEEEANEEPIPVANDTVPISVQHESTYTVMSTDSQAVADVPVSNDNTLSFSAQSHVSTATETERGSHMSSVSVNSTQSPSRSQTPARHMSRSNSRSDWNDGQILADTTDSSIKRSDSTSTWARMKNTFSRSGSSMGRRSRTNSVATRDKRDNTESGRESGISLNSGGRESKTEGAIPSSWQQTVSITQSPAASASILSLSSPPPRGGVSPIPPPSDTDNSKYNDPKLFPFPGMVKLQEESMRKGMSISASSPDVTHSMSTSSDKPLSSASSTSGHSTEMVRERKLSHQASDTHLLPKFQVPNSAPLITPSNSQVGYFPVPRTPPPTQVGSTSKLPTTREGVRKWLKTAFFPQSVGNSTNAQSRSSTPNGRPVDNVRKPSLSDLLARKDVENISDWEDLDKPKAGTSANSTIKTKSPPKDVGKEVDIQETTPDDLNIGYYADPFPTSPRMARTNGLTVTNDEKAYSRHVSSTALYSPTDLHSSTTPDPASSVDDSPAPSVSHSSLVSASSSTSSNHSRQDLTTTSAKPAEILERLDHVLSSVELNRMWSTAVVSPPRRLLLSSPVLQVINSNTVKDRFLFLFTDILVIAKPVQPERYSILDTVKTYPPDRKFIVKSVVHLSNLRLCTDRDDEWRQSTSYPAPRPPHVARFIQMFNRDPDASISELVDTGANPRETLAALGRLLVQLPELDRAKLGEYLSRRSSRNVLKAYIDAFEFSGLAIDMALRIFFLSIHIPQNPANPNALEYLLEAFAGRWYEANAGNVAFDRDLAARLVRSIIRLSEVFHSPIALDPASGYSRIYVNPKDFIEAFRRHDLRGSVSDHMLESIYTSVRQEKLSQARSSSGGRLSVTLKRPPPSRLIYRRQSEPIVVRIPQPDQSLTIQLHGKDLSFEPSTLTFAKSSEASFRVTATSLGPKSMIMACSGPNAPNYGGLPLRVTFMVERAFMRNTFQLAFLNHLGNKRKYMFSVDDPVIRHEWTSSLKRQVDAAATSSPPELPAMVQVQVYRAAEAISFNVLRDTLVGTMPSTHPYTEHTITTPSFNGNGSHNRFDSGSYNVSDRMLSELGYKTYGPDASGKDGNTVDVSNASGQPRLWTSSELESLCQQNSSIALVLSFLQAALPYDTDEEPADIYSSSPYGVLNSR